MKKNKFNTYVISDLHSHFNVFEKFLKDINPEDKVYFLGDAIDKGPDGLKVLEYIMKNNNQIQMVIGNHELMMYDYLSSRFEYEEEIKNKELDFMTRHMLEHHEKQWLDLNCGWNTLKDFETKNEEEKLEIYKFIENLPIVLRNNVKREN